MSLRVISGTAKGCRLKRVPGDTTRPIMDRVKEALFNILGRDVMGTVFLDLFAGTGSVGIEALSRGAAKAVFVEFDREALRTIQTNLATTKLADNAIVKRSDVLQLLKQSPEEPVDFIYVAPPQYKGLWLRTLELLDENPLWLANGPTVIVQIDPTEREAFSLKHLAAYDERRYGNTLLWFFSGEAGS